MIQVQGTTEIAALQQLKTPAISTINRGANSTEGGINVFEVCVLGILEFYGVEWSKNQIRESAELLFNEYYWLHIAELKHCITKIKTGNLILDDGKPFRVFGRFSPSHLQECFSCYAAESLRVRQQQFINKSNEERAGERHSNRSKEQMINDARLKSHEAHLKVFTEKMTKKGKDEK